MKARIDCLDAARPSLHLILEDDQGRRGVGEATPLLGRSRESFGECRRELEAIDWAAVHPLEAEPTIPQLRTALRRCGLNSPAARFAVETALLDLLGRTLELPVVALLSGPPRRTIDLSALLVESDLLPAVAEADAAVRRGVRTFKCKMSAPVDLDEEVTRLAAVRSAIGDRELRIDANQSTPRDQCAARMRAWASFQPEFVEEPVAGGLLGVTPPPETGAMALAADESLLDAGAAERLEARPLVRALVLKPMLLGGFVATLTWAEHAARAGVDVIVTHSFDGPIALAAAAHLALALPGRLRACGLQPHAKIGTWPHPVAEWIGPAQIRAPEGAGIQ